MKAKLLLRTASLVLLFHLLGHLFGHLNWKKDPTPAKQQVIELMTSRNFPFMGAVHSLGDYYEGYGWATAIALLFFALTLWLLSSAPLSLPLVRQLLAASGVCLLAWALMELLFFFPFAALLTLVSALLTLWALAQSGKIRAAIRSERSAAYQNG